MQVDGSMILNIALASITAVVGWLVIKAINGIENSILAVSKKVDAMAAQETTILVELATLRTRLVHVELLVMGRLQISDLKRDEKP